MKKLVNFVYVLLFFVFVRNPFCAKNIVDIINNYIFQVMCSLLRLSTAILVVAITLLSGIRAASLEDLTSPALQRTMQRMYEDCNRSADGFSICIKAKLITFLDRFAQIDSISVSDGVKVVRTLSPNALDVDDKNGWKVKDDWEQALPRGLEAKDEAMTDVLVRKAVRMLSERTLRVDLPSFSAMDVGRGLEEGNIHWVLYYL